MKIMYRCLIGAALFTSLAVTSSCLSDNDEPFDSRAQFEKENAAIDSHVTSQNNGFIIKDTATGVVLNIFSVGDRLPASVPTNTVVSDYVGTLFPSGTEFDDGEDVGFPLEDGIYGWVRAFSLLPQGSVADIYIPSAFGYGQSGYSTIPGNTSLKFHVTFKEVKLSAAEKNKLISDTTIIAEHLEDNGIVAVRDTTGLMYVISEEGTGATPSMLDKVRVRYKIRPLKDTDKDVKTKDFGEINSTTNRMSVYNNSRVIDYITGVKVALLKMKEGGKATLYIPSGLGYGSYSYYDPNSATPELLIGTNKNFVVDLEFLEILE